MNRPLFRARNLDPSKRIRLLVDPHENSNSNDLTNSISQSSSSSPNLRLSLSSTSTQHPSSQQSLGTTAQFSQPCVRQIPFVSGMEREEETVDKRINE